MCKFDKRFEEVLGPAAARALAEWAGTLGIGLTVSRVFVNGRSSATVVAAYEELCTGGVRKVVLKYDPVPDVSVGSGEAARHRLACEEAGAFRPHLAALLHEPIRVRDGTWITVQEYADEGLVEADVLTSVLAATPGVRLTGIRTTPWSAGQGDLAAVCAHVCATILRDWVAQPRVEWLTVSQFLRRHLGNRAEPGKPLARLADRWPGQEIRLPGEAAQLPNPFALVFDPSPGSDVDVPGLVGKSHGDVHTENIIVGRDGQHFWLIDLARYSATAPVTQDPVQLELAIVNRTLVELAPAERETLLRVLTGSATSGMEGLPPWLVALLAGVRDACHAWIGRSGLGAEWRMSRTLSTVACGLIFAARPTTSGQNREWFLRLAARAAAAFAGLVVHDDPKSDPAPPMIDDGGLGQLCLVYDRLIAAIGPSGRQTVEDLAARARLGVDIHEELDHLARARGVSLDLVRGELPGLRQRASAREVFGCPLRLAPCTRQAEQLPGGAHPYCRVADRGMARQSG